METIEEALIKHMQYIKALTNAIKAIKKECQDCEDCNATGSEPNTANACRTCGGYGYNPRGDIREAITQATTLIQR